jgi:hypothetical protein
MERDTDMDILLLFLILKGQYLGFLKRRCSAATLEPKNYW